MTDEQARLVHEGLDKIDDRLTMMAGHMQGAYTAASEAVEILNRVKASIIICEHTDEMRTGYYKSNIDGMIAFWCKGCQSEQVIPESEVE